jgi:hypothetical protein
MRKVCHGISLQAQEGILVWLIALHLGTPEGKHLLQGTARAVSVNLLWGAVR